MLLQCMVRKYLINHKTIFYRIQVLKGFDYISLQMWFSFIGRLSIAKIVKLPKLFNIAVQDHHHEITSVSFGCYFYE